jgi:formylglycine-generating enzyme required for sulfatase activity
MKIARTSALGLAVGWALVPGTSAQTPAALDIQVYAGLTITGSVGTVYSIDYVTDLAQTNTPSAWRCLEYLQLSASPYLWADKSAPATVKRFYRAVAMQAPTNMVFIPPGTFMMGSPTNEVGRSETEGPRTAVIISRGFWMGKHEVTQGEYMAVMGNNPSWFSGVRGPGEDYGIDLARPVESLSGWWPTTDAWEYATNYCGTQTQRERAAGRIAANAVYRLPTEAEWEHACRAGTSTQFSYGDDPGYWDRENFQEVGYTNLARYAWYSGNSGGQTHPVGQKLPNPWGLYDMHGNVREWCQDRCESFWSMALPGGIALDPQGPDSGSAHVARGGCWGSRTFLTTASSCRSAARTASPGWDGGPIEVGFRVVLAPGQP